MANILNLSSLSNLSLRTKLVALAVASSCALLAVGMIGIFQTKALVDAFQPISKENLPATKELGELMAQFYETRIGIRSLILRDVTEEQMLQSKTSIEKALVNLEKSLKNVDELLQGPNVKQALADLHSAWNSYKEGAAAIAQSIQPQMDENALNQLTQTIRKLAQEKARPVESAIEALVHLQMVDTDHHVAIAQHASDMSFLLMMGSSAVLVLLLMFLSITTANRLYHDVGHATGSVGTTAATVSSSVTQVASAAQDVTSAVQQQSASIQQTSSAIEEISAMVKRSADRSAAVEASTQESRGNAERGKEIVDRLTDAMNRLQTSNESHSAGLRESNSKVEHLVKVIEEVTGKTRVINDIVFQTKLLSFNASVEAARAGENGKGFAVVAEEIGNLARMSGEAAAEINALLDSSVAQVRETVEANRQQMDAMVNTSTELLKESVKVTAECQEALSRIVAASESVTTMVSEITTGNQESAKGVQEITEALRDIHLSSQVTARAAQTSQAVSRELAQEATGLRHVASKLNFSVQGKPWISKFEWKDAYRLQVDAMDNEHKILIAKINALADALDGTNKTLTMECFSDLASYTAEHFGHEEAYMQKIGYMDLDLHKQIHTNLLAQVGEFGERMKEGKADTEELMNFLNDWLLKHILGVDMKYARFSRGERSKTVVSLQRSSTDDEGSNAA